jgi:hypothetical protein
MRKTKPHRRHGKLLKKSYKTWWTVSRPWGGIEIDLHHPTELGS